jgi:putative FmdB family regulatory protein
MGFAILIANRIKILGNKQNISVKGKAMPIFEYHCKDCNKTSEIILLGDKDTPICGFCNSQNLEKLVSAHASASGPVKNTMPGLGDTACCGSSPGQASNCAGPGSCCGRNMD